MSSRVYLLVVGFVGVCLLACVVGIVVLSLANPQRTIPDVLQNVTVGSLTGLVGLLVRPPSQPT
jgi:hypothetical protein